MIGGGLECLLLAAVRLHLNAFGQAGKRIKTRTAISLTVLGLPVGL